MRENSPNTRAVVAAHAHSSPTHYVARLLSRARLFALAALLAVMAAGAARAQVDPGSSIEFGSVGVAHGQTARLSVVWTKVLPPDPCYPPDPCTPPASFRATLSFYDADGREVARRDETLYQNRAASLNFTPRDLARGARMQLRAAVTVEQDPSGVIPCIVPTVEIVDADGLTSILNPGMPAGFNRQPDPPMPPDYFEFGFVSAGAGRTMRVNAAYPRGEGELPPGPCNVTFSFHDEDGHLVAQTTRTIYPGQTVSFDAPPTRGRLRATVGVASLVGGVIPCIKPSAEVYDDSTGRTVVLYPGGVIGE